MTARLAEGARVADRRRDRAGGRIVRVRSAWVDVQWPDGTASTYGIDAARESLTVETRALFDIFGLGIPV